MLLYALTDSSILEIPNKGDTCDSSSFRASVTYQIKDMDAAQTQLKKMAERFNLYMESRDETLSNYDLSKSFRYKINTSNFLMIEQALDSAFGQSMHKNVHMSSIISYSQMRKELENLIKAFKLRLDNYYKYADSNNRAELGQSLKDMENSIKYSRNNLINYCNNKSELTVTLSLKYKNTSLPG